MSATEQLKGELHKSEVLLKASTLLVVKAKKYISEHNQNAQNRPHFWEFDMDILFNLLFYLEVTIVTYSFYNPRQNIWDKVE